MRIINQIKKFSIATAVVSLALGILFTAFPAQCIKYTSLALGVSLIAAGLIAAIEYIRDKSSKISLILGIIVMICGVIVCAKYKAIISLIVIIFGIFILCTGLVNLGTSIKAIATFRISGWFTLALSILTSIFGIIAITKSSQLTETIVRFIGIALLIYSVLDIVSYFQVKTIVDSVSDNKHIDDIETDATISYVDDSDS